MKRTDGREFLKASHRNPQERRYRRPSRRQPPVPGDQKETRYIDCSDVPIPYGERLVDDVLNRTETANPQEQTFLAMEVALRAQAQARRLSGSW